jgi:4-amino-4-deoxy-L-arabinose transferase-like glycosyltransferase
MRRGVEYIIELLQRISSKYSDKQILGVLLITGFAIRLLYGFIIFSNTDESQFMDSWDYIYLAQNMLDQGIFPLEVHKWSREIGPGYSLIIATSLYIFGHTYWPLIFINVLASTAITIVIYYLAKLVYKKEVAVLAAGWSVFYVQFFKFVPMILKESLVIFLFTLTIYQVACFLVGKRKRWDILLLITSFAILIHVDERYFFYLPFYAAALLFSDGDWQKRFILAATFAVGVCISIIPWSYRNFLFYDRVVVLTERTTKFTDPFFNYPPLKSYADLMSYDPANHPLYEAITDSIRAGHKVRIKNVKFIPDIERAVREGIDVHTFTRPEHYWEEFKELWRPAKFGTSMAAYGYRYQAPWFMSSNIVFLISYGVLLPFFLWAFIDSFLRPRKVAIFMFVIIFIHTIIHVFLAHARERYRIPIDPLIIILSLQMIHHLTMRWVKPSALNSLST